MKHLFVCREYPPAAYPPGGIGTYVRHMCTLLADAGESVHVIAHRWDGAPRVREEFSEGRLVVHRVALDQATPSGEPVEAWPDGARIAAGLLASTFPSQAFAWQAALLAERLVEREGIDVIEAQEWEAPLYYLQQRRRAGLGPAARPPCFVHLHSPTEEIFTANGWDTTVVDYAPASVLEARSIQMADGVLCPSHFLADRARVRYQIPAANLHVVPYPLGRTGWLDRPRRVWTDGLISYVGRLEPRKGLFEWADALASVNPSDLPTLEFVGGDTPRDVAGGTMVGELVWGRIPWALRPKLQFHGSLEQSDMKKVLGRSWAVVIPSRWENLPYSCIEAMASGLPVIVSPHGGMRELATDGVSGWVADDGSSAGLARALHRALKTSAVDRERMGHAAAAAVTARCDNARIVEQHLAIKRAAASEAGPAIPSGSAADRGSVAVVVRRNSRKQGDGVTTPAQTGHAFPGSTVFDSGSQAGTDVESIGAAAFQTILVVDPHVEVEPRFLTMAHAWFTNDSAVGLISGWTRENSPSQRVHIQSSPDLPHLSDGELLSPFVAVRAEAFRGVAQPDMDLASARDWRQLFARILEAGWRGETHPEILASMTAAGDAAAPAGRKLRYSGMAQAVQRLHMPIMQWLLSAPADVRRAFVRETVRHPARSARQLVARSTRRRR